MENHTQNKPSTGIVEGTGGVHKLEDVFRTDQADFAERHLNDEYVEQGGNVNQGVKYRRSGQNKLIQSKNGHHLMRSSTKKRKADILDNPAVEPLLGASQHTRYVLLPGHKEKREEDKKKFGFIGPALMRFFERIKTFFLPRSWFEFFTSRMFIYTCKAVLALAITFIFIFVDTIATWYETSTFLIQVAVVFFDMSAAPGFGITFGLALTAMMGFVLGISKLALYSSIDHPWGLAAWLSFIIFLISYWRYKVKPKWSLIGVQAALATIFIIIYGFRAREVAIVTTEQIFKTVFTFITGTWVCVLVNTFVFPHSAHAMLMQEMYAANKTMIEIIEFSARVFSGDVDLSEQELLNKLDSLDKRSKMHFMSTIKAMEAMRNEVYLSRYSPNEAKEILNKVFQLMGHSRLLLSCCNIKPEVRACKDLQILIRDLTPQLQKLMVEECCIQLRAMNHRIATRIRRLLPYKFKDGINLSDSLTAFDQANKSILASGLIQLNTSDNWADVFVAYFYIGICREYVKLLHELEIFLKTKRRRIPRPYIPMAITEWVTSWYHFILGAPKRITQFIKTRESSSIPARNKELTPKIRIKSFIRSSLLVLVSLVYDKAVAYGLKCALGVFLATLPQWIDNSMDWYALWRGEYVAIYVVILFGPTFAVSYTSSLFRIIGTIFGAVIALLTYIVFGLELRIYGIIIVWVLFAFPCFLCKYSGRSIGKIAPAAFITYASTVIVSWQQRNNPGYFTYWEVVYKRLLATTIAIISVIILDRILWPVLAKDQAAELLGRTIKGLSKLYALIIDTLNNNADSKTVSAAQTLSRTLKGSIIASEALLMLASSEPTLHEPIPYKYYQAVTEKLTKILQILMITNILSSYGFPPWLRSQIDFPALQKSLKSADKFILLLFWVAEKTITTKTPLPQAIQSAKKFRRRVLEQCEAVRTRMELNSAFMEKHVTSLVRWFSVVMLYQYLMAELDELMQVLVRIYGEEVSITTWSSAEQGEEEDSEEEVTTWDETMTRSENEEGGLEMKRRGKRKDEEEEEEVHSGDDTIPKTASTDESDLER